MSRAVARRAASRAASVSVTNLKRSSESSVCRSMVRRMRSTCIRVSSVPLPLKSLT
ncbi:MAG: hypothetical protein AB2L13_09220 [Spirochaetota bacterium]